MLRVAVRCLLPCLPTPVHSMVHTVQPRLLGCLYPPPTHTPALFHLSCQGSATGVEPTTLDVREAVQVAGTSCGARHAFHTLISHYTAQVDAYPLLPTVPEWTL